MLFDKEGILNIDELVAQRPTFRKIMEDQIVTDDELTNQANLVVNLLKKLEQTLISPRGDQMNTRQSEISATMSTVTNCKISKSRHLSSMEPTIFALHWLQTPSMTVSRIHAGNFLMTAVMYASLKIPTAIAGF